MKAAFPSSPPRCFLPFFSSFLGVANPAKIESSFFFLVPVDREFSSSPPAVIEMELFFSPFCLLIKYEVAHPPPFFFSSCDADGFAPS